MQRFERLREARAQEEEFSNEFTQFANADGATTLTVGALSAEDFANAGNSLVAVAQKAHELFDFSDKLGLSHLGASHGG